MFVFYAECKRICISCGLQNSAFGRLSFSAISKCVFEHMKPNLT